MVQFLLAVSVSYYSAQAARGQSSKKLKKQ
jgi:hypothetical protein